MTWGIDVTKGLQQLISKLGEHAQMTSWAMIGPEPDQILQQVCSSSDLELNSMHRWVHRVIIRPESDQILQQVCSSSNLELNSMLSWLLEWWTEPDQKWQKSWPADVLQQLIPQLGNALGWIQILFAGANWNVQPEIWTIVVGVSMRRELIFHLVIYNAQEVDSELPLMTECAAWNPDHSCWCKHAEGAHPPFDYLQCTRSWLWGTSDDRSIWINRY